MVDFRYHLVSLVSVFIALAIGIILGAGPLQNSIGNALNSQVETLRDSRDSLRDELDSTQAELDDSNAAIVAAGEQLLPGTLTGREIAIVRLPGADDDAVTAIQDELGSAGATISANVTLTNNFAVSDQSTYRGALASQLSDYIDGVPEGASDDQIVAAGLDYVLRNDPNDANVKIVLGSLTASDSQLIEVSGDITAAADAIVFVAPDTYVVDTTDASADASAPSEAEISAQTQLFAQAFATSAGRGAAVAVGRALDDGDVLIGMRSTETGSTVDSVGTPTSAINTAFAVASEISGDHVVLGSQQGADQALGTRVDASAQGEPSAEDSETNNG